MFSKSTKFESLLEAVPDALVGMDKAGTIRFVNHQTEALFGYDRDELVGQPIETLVPENLGRIYEEHREGYFADPRTRSMGLDLELSAQHHDGQTFPVDVSLSSIDTGDVLLEVTAVRDARRQREAAKNAQRMVAIIEHSEDAIIGQTIRGTITSWNPAAEKIFGYSSREIIGSSISFIAPEDRAGEIDEILERVKAGQSVTHFETIRVRKDGKIIGVSISVSPISDEEGVIIGASTIARDVTERQQAFDSARAMIEASLDPLVLLSPEGEVNQTNEAMVKVTGVPRDQLIGTDFFGYFTEPDKAREIYRGVFADQVADVHPLTIRHQDDTLTDVLYNASVHRGRTGTPLGVFASARDVSKVTQALESVRAMIESSLDPMVSIDSDGKINDVNEATVEVTGHPRARLLGTAFSDYFTDPAKANEIYQRAFENGNTTNYPLTICHESGRLTEVLYNAAVYHDSSGTTLGVFATARDVTEQNQAQRDLAEQRSLESERMADLVSFQRLTVGRELQMIELKKEIEYLSRFAPGKRDERRDA